MTFIAYLLAILTVIATLFFFSKWQNGVFFKIAFISIFLRLLLIPIIDKFSVKIMPEEIEECLLWYEKWQEYLQTDGLLSTFIHASDLNVPGMYWYFSLYAGWFIDLTNAKDFIPLRVFTACLSIFVLIPIVGISKKILQLSVNYWFLLFIINWPIWLMYSCQLGRTIPSVILPIWGIYLLTELKNKIKIRTLFLFIIIVYLTFIFRSVYILFFVSYLGGWYLLKVPFKFVPILKTTIYIVIGIFFFSFFISDSFLFSLAFSFIGEEKWMYSDQLDGGSSYLIQFIPASLTDLLWYLPLQGIYFLLSPMPWDIISLNQLISSFFSLSLFWVWYRGYLKIDFITEINSSNFKIISLSLLLSSLLLGAGVKNAGAAQRWRLPITMCILAISLPVFTKKI